MLVGREKEFKKIESLIGNSLKHCSPLSIYISGPPGTGKTATVKSIISIIGQKFKVKHVSIDCFASFTVASLSNEILNKLNGKNNQNKRAVQSLEEHFNTTKEPILILLDEIDNLKSHKGKIICAAFNWPAKYPGRIIIIGISNSLDLTERILPKNKFTTNPPHRITFAAYTSSQLIRILELRLNKENIDSKTIELCARKVSSMTGDVRQALSIASQILADIKKEEEQEDEKENAALTPMKKAKRGTATTSTLKRAHSDMGEVTPKKNACREVLAAINKTMASPCQRSKLPQHPSILLATLMRLLNNSSSSSNSRNNCSIYRTPPRIPNSKMAIMPESLSVSKDHLFQAYIKVCERLFLRPLETDELESAYEVLESQAMIKLSKAANRVGDAGQRICLMVEMALARRAINDDALLASIEDMEI